jgi:ADP-ribose pyrophosphatase
MVAKPAAPRTAADIEVLSRAVPHAGFLRVEQYRLRHRLFAGGWTPPLLREVCVRGTVAGVLPYDPARDQLVLVEQFRMGPFAAGAAPWMIEIVAGFIEDGETPEQVAARECIEECGCTVSALLPITCYFPSPGGLAERVHLFCGRVDSRQALATAGLVDDSEDIRVQVVPWRAARSQIARGGYANAATLIALQWLALNRRRVRRAWLGAPEMAS